MELLFGHYSISSSYICVYTTVQKFGVKLFLIVIISLYYCFYYNALFSLTLLVYLHYIQYKFKPIYFSNPFSNPILKRKYSLQAITTLFSLSSNHCFIAAYHICSCFYLLPVPRRAQRYTLWLPSDFNHFHSRSEKHSNWHMKGKRRARPLSRSVVIVMFDVSFPL